MQSRLDGFDAVVGERVEQRRELPLNLARGRDPRELRARGGSVRVAALFSLFRARARALARTSATASVSAGRSDTLTAGSSGSGAPPAPAAAPPPLTIGNATVAMPALAPRASAPS